MPLTGLCERYHRHGRFFQKRCGFAANSIRLLADERATKAAIVERLQFLVNGARAGDRLLFHYSGHGAQMPTRNTAAEVDKLDEVICPVDFDWSEAHAIRDKEFAKIFAAVPTGVEFIWISDSCHSGDLSRDFPKLEPGHSNKTMLPPADIDWRLQTAKELLATDAKKITATSLASLAKELNVALISGCQADETSADAVFNKRPNGALTYYLLKELHAAEGLQEPLTALVRKVTKAVSTYNDSQHPQLEGNSAIASRPFATRKG